VNYKLSICIPTYNRARFLPELLDSIINQVDLNEPVEICVSDNASTDNTKEMIEQYRRQYPHIVYFCFEQNRGADHNYLNAVKIASGTFCWLMGSDDRLISGAIPYVLTQLDDSYAGYSVRTQPYDFALLKPRHCTFFKKNDLLKDVEFKDAETIYIALGTHFGYISGHVVNRELWGRVISQIPNIHDYYNAYVHVYVIGRMIQLSPKWKYLSKLCVCTRGDNDSFLNQGYLKRMCLDIDGYTKIASDLFGRNSRVYRQHISKMCAQHIQHHVMVAKLKNIPDFMARALMITAKNFWDLPVFWLMVMPIFIMPGWSLKAMRFAYRVTLKKWMRKEDV
jgi:abequosyltransferase